MRNPASLDSTCEQTASHESGPTVLQQSSARIRARLDAERVAPDKISAAHAASIPAR